MHNKPRSRSTNATRQRIANLKAIIARLHAVGRMRRDEINLFLCMSPSGGRKYIKDMVADKIIEIVDFEPTPPKAKSGAPIYGLNKDSGIIDAFLLSLDQAPQSLTQRSAMADYTNTGPRMQKVQLDDGRSVHMLRDDAEHRPRSIKFKIPAPCPVLAAFYGFAGV